MAKKPKEEKKKNSGNLRKMRKQRLEKEKLLATEEKLRVAADQWLTTLDAISNAICLLDIEGKIIRCNKAMSNLLDKPSSEIIGRRCWELMHGSAKPIPECPMVRMKKSLKREILTLPLMGRWFEITADPIIDKRGKLAGAVHIIVDITKSKRIEEILEKERQELKLIIDSSPIIVFYKDKEGKFVRVNKTFAEAIKLPEEEFVGKTVFDLYSAKIAQGMTNDDQEVLKSGRPKLNIIEQYESASGIRWVQTDKIPICDKNGMPLGLIGFAQDITERKKTEEALKEAKAFSESTLNAIDDIFYAFDSSGKMLIWNKAVSRITGYSDTELSSKRPTDFFLEEDIQRVAESIERIWKEGSSKAEFNLVLKDGRQVPYEFTGSILKDGNGNIIGFSGIGRDITERKKAEEALREAKKFSDSLIASMQEGFSILDSRGVHIDVNPAFCQMTGFSREEIIGVGAPHPYWPPETYEEIERAFQKTLRGELGSWELTFMRKNGERFPAIVSPSHIKDNQGNIINYFATIKDITEPKRAEEMLQKSELKYRQLIEQAPDTIFVVDGEGNLLHVNLTGQKMLGYSEDEFCKMTTADTYPLDEMAVARRRLMEMRTMRAGETMHFERQMRRKNRTLFPVEISVGALKDGTTHAIIRDITERKRTEEQLQGLLRRLVEIQEADHRLLATELHDQIGQNLTALSINLNIMHNQFSNKFDKKIMDRLEDSLKLVEETIGRIRDVMAGLRPPVLDDYGLVVAMRCHCKQFSERTGIAIMLQGEEFSLHLPLFAELALFRIFQEVLTNVAKHAQAKQVSITLEEVDGKVQLILTDDGIGFDPAVIQRLKERPRWGLITMEERAKALGGNLYVESAPGKGTRVIVQLPS